MSALDRYRGLGGRYLVAAAVAIIALPVFVLAFGAPVWLGLLTSVAIFAVLGLFAAVRTPMINAERAGQGDVRPALRGNPAVKAAFSDALPALARLEKVVETTPKNLMRDRLARIAETGRKIVLEVEGEPARLPSVSRLLTYYLPRTADLAEAYVQSRAKGALAPQRQAAMDEVIAKLEDAFTHYESRLVDDDMRGVDMDIRLLNEALKEDLGR
jgi:hypothetical protein